MRLARPWIGTLVLALVGAGGVAAQPSPGDAPPVRTLEVVVARDGARVLLAQEAREFDDVGGHWREGWDVRRATGAAAAALAHVPSGARVRVRGQVRETTVDVQGVALVDEPAWAVGADADRVLVRERDGAAAWRPAASVTLGAPGGRAVRLRGTLHDGALWHGAPEAPAHLVWLTEPPAGLAAFGGQQVTVAGVLLPAVRGRGPRLLVERVELRMTTVVGVVTDRRLTTADGRSFRLVFAGDREGRALASRVDEAEAGGFEVEVAGLAGGAGAARVLGPVAVRPSGYLPELPRRASPGLAGRVR